ncbi:hypothetical protein ACFL27_16360 [candidate division CSSED10-310 bacterium]|uniref:Uncharacterized protein n=1 Tax=candidate division CSSED10-310 bacterium TaxID=2855610 RepID=A0ABV6YZZ2_UNCC1
MTRQQEQVASDDEDLTLVDDPDTVSTHTQTAESEDHPEDDDIFDFEETLSEQEQTPEVDTSPQTIEASAPAEVEDIVLEDDSEPEPELEIETPAIELDHSEQSLNGDTTQQESQPGEEIQFVEDEEIVDLDEDLQQQEPLTEPETSAAEDVEDTEDSRLTLSLTRKWGWMMNSMRSQNLK